MDRWRNEIRAQRHRLSPKECVDPTWAATDNDYWWVNFFNVQHDEELSSTDGLIGSLTS
jgi:hypothetical protein